MAAAFPADVAQLEVLPSSPGMALRSQFMDRRDRTVEGSLAAIVALPRDATGPIAPTTPLRMTAAQSLAEGEQWKELLYKALSASRAIQHLHSLV